MAGPWEKYQAQSNQSAANNQRAVNNTSPQGLDDAPGGSPAPFVPATASPIPEGQPWLKYQEAPKTEEPNQAGFGERALKIGEGALKTGVSFAKGVAETINPLAAPHGLEVLVRGIGNYVTTPQGLGESFRSAEKEAKTPNISVDQTAVGLRSAARIAAGIATGNIQSADQAKEIVNQENESQKAFNQNIINPTAETAGELTSAAVSLGSFIKEFGPKAVSGISKLLDAKIGNTSISETAKMALSKIGLVEEPMSKIVQAQKLTSDLLGNVSPEIGQAIFQRSDQVEKALKAGPQGQSLLPNVEAVRGHIDATQSFIGEMVGDFKTVIRQNTETEIPTTGMIQLLSAGKNELRLQSGQNILKPADISKLNEYKQMLENPADARKLLRADLQSQINELTADPSADPSGMAYKALNDKMKEMVSNVPQGTITKQKFLTPRDASLIIDKLDSDLQPLYNGNLQTNVQRSTFGILKTLRDRLNESVEGAYPAYQQLKNEYSEYKNLADGIKQKMDSTGGESFIANLFGQNKTEARQQLLDLIDHGKNAADAIEDLSRTVKTGNRELTNNAKGLISTFKKSAAESDFQGADQFLRDVADKLAARKLQDVSNSGLSDIKADRIQRLVESAVNKAQLRGQAVGGGAGATIGSLFGLTGAGAGAVVGGKVGGVIGKSYGLKTAIQQYDPMRIFELIRESKGLSSSAQKTASEILEVKDALGSDVATKFMGLIPMSSDMKNSIEQVTKASGSINSLNGLANQLFGEKNAAQ